MHAACALERKARQRGSGEMRQGCGHLLTDLLIGSRRDAPWGEISHRQIDICICIQVHSSSVNCNPLRTRTVRKTKQETRLSHQTKAPDLIAVQEPEPGHNLSPLRTPADQPATARPTGLRGSGEAYGNREPRSWPDPVPPAVACPCTQPRSLVGLRPRQDFLELFKRNSGDFLGK